MQKNVGKILTTVKFLSVNHKANKYTPMPLNINNHKTKLQEDY